MFTQYRLVNISGVSKYRSVFIFSVKKSLFLDRLLKSVTIYLATWRNITEDLNVTQLQITQLRHFFLFSPLNFPALLGNLHKLPPKTKLNNGHKFCGMELEHIQFFLALSRHFIVMLTAALLFAICWSYNFSRTLQNKFSFHGGKPFHYHKLFHFR
jgi:hypothetical protein